jgi:hypothetical protein
MIQERDEVVLTCDLPEQKLAAGRATVMHASHPLPFRS